MLRPIADEFDVSLGTSGWVSTAQLAGFVIGSWTAGRHLRPVRKVFITLALLGFMANLCAAAAPNLAVLGTARFAGGISLGLAAWFAWQDAFGNADKTSDVAVVDPPRVGLGIGGVAAVTAAFPRVIAYVSCDPASLNPSVAGE